MALTSHDIARIAHLARLQLSDDEARQMHAELTRFFGLVEQMKAVDTDGVAPLAQPLAALGEVALPLRADQPADCAALRAAAQSQAPAVHEGLYLVPRVVE
jgi:aspartyl-tRNA(Asn)/glutamyl-tRNA(Gln) amidotransferase subunit C